MLELLGRVGEWLLRALAWASWALWAYKGDDPSPSIIDDLLLGPG